MNFADGRYTGFGLGDFLLGLSSTQRLSLFHQPDLYADGWQVYGQDVWRIAQGLTVNYGLRYEYFTPMFDRRNLLTNIDPATGAIVTAKDGSVRDRTLIEPDRNDFAPRVGLAWTITRRVALRAGYGIFYQQQDRYGSESQLGLNLPQLVDVSINANSASDPPAFRFSEGFTSLAPENVNCIARGVTVYLRAGRQSRAVELFGAAARFLRARGVAVAAPFFTQDWALTM